MHYVYDFDSTLYATARLWARWVEILRKYGYATPDVTIVEKKLNESLGLPFTPRRHAELIGMIPSYIDEAVLEQDTDIRSLGSSLVFDDVVPFLEKGRSAHRHSLLTFGDSEYQMGKIDASGIHNLVGDIHVADLHHGKADILRELVESGSEPITFIDDHTWHLQFVHEAGLPVEIVRMRRPGEPHTPDEHPLDNIAWRIVSSLDELSV